MGFVVVAILALILGVIIGRRLNNKSLASSYEEVVASYKRTVATDQETIEGYKNIIAGKDEILQKTLDQFEQIIQRYNNQIDELRRALGISEDLPKKTKKHPEDEHDFI